MAKAQLERSDLASPGAKFGQAAASLKRYKNSKAYRDELRTLAAAPLPTKGSVMELRRARLSRLEAESELTMLKTGETADVFAGVIKYQAPDAE